MLKNLKKEKLQNRLSEATKYFVENKYKTLLSLASLLIERNNLDGCTEQLDKLPSRDQLLEQLISKLKGKSVYKTLKQIHEKNVDALTKAKGLSSLITHCLIEMEQGHREYGILLPMLMEKQKDIILNNV